MQASLLICLIVFLVLLIVLERVDSIRIIIRFALSLAIMYRYIKAISDGKSIVLFSIFVVISLAVINIFIKNGIHKKSLSELISVLWTSGITSSIVFFICQNQNPKIYQDEIMSFEGLKNPENVLFGIFMIATLGIFMDIISRIICCLDERKDKTIDIPWKTQFFEGIEIGRKFVSEKINMIVLILIGVSFFPICANINKGMSIANIFNQHGIFACSLIAVVANIGLVLAVPITACCYASLNRKKTIYKTVSENKVDGKRSLKL